VIEIVEDHGSRHQFSLKAKSGQILLTSIDFIDKNQMDIIIKMLSTTPITRNHFERKTNLEGKFLFNLKDEDGNLIGTSQLYDSEMGMENGIKNLRNRLADL